MSGKQILAFEADPVYAQLFSDESQNRGYEVEIVADGAEGLEKAESTTPDIIYLCIELPRISGFSICNKIRKNPRIKDLPLVVSSDEATPETFEKHKKLKVRADAYLHKPFDAERIFEVFDELLGGSNGSGGGDVEELEEIEEIEEVEEVSEDETVAITGEEYEAEFGKLTGEIDLEDVELVEDEDELELDDDFEELEELDNLEDLDDIDELEEIGDLDDADEGSGQADDDVEALADQAFDAIAISEEPEVTPSQPPEAEEPRLSTPPEPSNDVGELQADNARLREQIRTLRNEISGVRASRGGGVSSREFLDLREQLNRKDRELLDMKDALNRTEKQQLDSRERVTELERHKADLEDRNLELEKQLAQFGENIADLQSDKEMMQKKSGDFQTRIDHLQTKIQTLEESMDEEVKGRKEEIAQLNAEKDSALSQFGNAKDQEREAALNSQKEELEKEMARALAEQKTDLDVKAEKAREEYLRDQRLRHEAAVEDIKAQLQRDTQDALAVQSAEHSAKIAEMEQNQKQALEEANQRYEGLTQEKGTVEENLTELQKELDMVRNELADNNKVIQQADAESAELRTNIQGLNQKREELEGQIEEHAKAAEALEAKGAEAEARINELANELDEANYVIERNSNLASKTRQALSIAAKLLDDIYYDEGGEAEEEEE